MSKRYPDTDDGDEQRLVDLQADRKRLRAALTQIKRVAASQYNKRAPSGSELCDEIAALAEDALKGKA